MSEYTRIAFLIGLLLIACHGAHAQTYDWYTAIGVGPSFQNELDATQSGVTVTADFDPGLGGYGAVGRRFSSFRAEGEVYVSVDDVDSLAAGGASIGASGNVTTIAFMVNGYYDFSFGSKWKPYIGGGVGFANVDFHDLSAAGVLVTDDDDTVFSYQLKAGVAYEFTPRWEGTLAYRYFGSEDGDFDDSSATPFTTDGVELHAVEIGVRYRW